MNTTYKEEHHMTTSDLSDWTVEESFIAGYTAVMGDENNPTARGDAQDAFRRWLDRKQHVSLATLNVIEVEDAVTLQVMGWDYVIAHPEYAGALRGRIQEWIASERRHFYGTNPDDRSREPVEDNADAALEDTSAYDDNDGDE